VAAEMDRDAAVVGGPPPLAGPAPRHHLVRSVGIPGLQQEDTFESGITWFTIVWYKITDLVRLPNSLNSKKE
jgi:hypothetical protein